MSKLRDPLKSTFSFSPSTILLVLTFLFPIAAEGVRRSDPEGGLEILVMVLNALPVYLAPTTLVLCIIYWFRYRRIQYVLEFVFMLACILWYTAGAA
jgi:hypothetical protein